MKLSELHIENFRSFKDEIICFEDYSCLVGPNGSGKSTILTALNIFFRNTIPNVNVLSLSKEDFHHGDTTKPIKITLTFTDLSAEAQDDLKEYYRQEKLIVSAIAVWDEGTSAAPVRQVGSRKVMADFASYFAKNETKASAQELKEMYKSIKEKYTDLPSANTKPAMEEALRNYEESHKDECVLKESTQEFYGFTKGSGILPKYIQWVYIPAVKDVSTEQEETKKTALGQLLERTVRTKVDFKSRIDALKTEIATKYAEIVVSEKGKLDNLSNSLQKRLREWSNPRTKLNLDWHFDEKNVAINEPFARISIGEDNFIGEIVRSGHGLQRAFLIALLQELTSSDESNAPNLILGFEEPELFQHPPQAHYMSSLLEKLTKHNSQVIITTHSPYFVPSNGFETIRVIRKCPVEFKSSAKNLQTTQVEETISKALGKATRSPSSLLANVGQIMLPSLKELYFTSIAILVEGLEDIAFLSTYLHLLNQWDSFRACGCHFIATGGKINLSRTIAISQGFSIPHFVIFDADRGHKGDPEQKEKNLTSNSCILNLCNISSIDPLSPNIIWTKRLIMWPTDIGDAVRNSYGAAEWDSAKAEVKKENGWDEVTSKKNGFLIAATIEKLWKDNKKSDVLEKVCQSIIEFALHPA